MGDCFRRMGDPMASRYLCRLLGRKRRIEIIRYSLVSAVFLRVL